MMKMDWKEAAFHARQRPLSLALSACTVFFAFAGLSALTVSNIDIALGAAMVMILFFFLTLIANAER
jgi:hypothetical protein